MSADPEARPRSEAFRFVLRHATRAEHEGLDRHPAFTPLLEGTMGLDGYRDLMLAFHGFYRSVDDQLFDACGHHGVGRFGFVYEPRTAILAGDLAVLGAQGCPPAIPVLHARNLSVDTAEGLCGSLYVFEGSLLGASMMCASTDALLDGVGAGGNAYWQWCREAGAKRWAMTCQLIEALATTDQAKDRMVHAARTAFRSFAHWLDAWNDGLFHRSRAQC